MPLPSHARVVIIGGGAVGASSLYHLALAGWTDCLLIERNELTAGSTWHAAGNCPNFSANWTVMQMQGYSMRLYRELAERVDYPMNYHVTGSIRLAHSTERMREFEHARAMGHANGIEMEMMTTADMQAKYPFLEVHDLEGGLWDPTDGDIDPAQLTQALAKGARDLGAKIERFCAATGVRRENGAWIVETEKGEVRCEYVVNAAGYYAGRVAEWFKPYGGRDLPMAVMSHQYMLTEEIDEIAKFTEETGAKLPLLRDPDSSYYLRQEKTGLNLGPYERNCRSHWQAANDAMPVDFSFQLFPDDLERLEWYLEDAMARVPLLGQTGVNKVINGPIPYAPDGHPLIGPMPGVPNAFEACVFTFGIAQSGGAGKFLSEWITEGATENDTWSVDPRRFTAHADQAFSKAKAEEVYGHEYAMHFPHHAWPAGRDKKHSPVHERLAADGAQFGAYNGWERANWFAQPGDDTSEESTQTWDRNGPWAPRVEAECLAVRDGVGVLDLPGFSRFELQGPGAAEWLAGRIAGNLPKIGRLTLGYFPDDRGRILTEMSVIPHGEDHFTLITAAVAQWHDRDLLLATLPASVTLRDDSDAVSTLIVTGPESRALFARISDGDLERPWLSHQRAKVAGAEAMLARVSFAGELGWEVHAPMEAIPAIYDAVRSEGATPFGMFALNSMRLEKGYRAWKGDLSTDYTLYEMGLDRFVRPNKAQSFPGREALMAEYQRGPKQQITTLVLAEHPRDPLPMSNVWHGDTLAGQVTSAGRGYRSGKTIAYAMLPPGLTAPFTALEVEVFGERVAAEVAATTAVWDPENARLRA